jgi:hypothetical protein
MSYANRVVAFVFGILLLFAAACPVEFIPRTGEFGQALPEIGIALLALAGVWAIFHWSGRPTHDCSPLALVRDNVGFWPRWETISRPLAFASGAVAAAAMVLKSERITARAVPA